MACRSQMISSRKRVEKRTRQRRRRVGRKVEREGDRAKENYRDIDSVSTRTGDEVCAKDVGSMVLRAKDRR